MRTTSIIPETNRGEQMIETIIFLVFVTVFAVLVKRPGGYQDSVSQAIRQAPTQQAAEPTLVIWS